MIFVQAFILLLIQKIVICESLFFNSKNIFESINFGLEQTIPLATTVSTRLTVQKVDHFSPTDLRTWNQVYYVEKSYYKKGGHCYLWIEGESQANPIWFEVGYWQAHGKKNNAMLFMLEHRFYGDSQPFNYTKTSNLKYLTAHQALADIASFIVSMNKQYEFPEGTKWIVFGGSYAGNLAAWMRMKYPHLVHAAVASSAPVMAQFDFPEYLDVVSNAFGSYNKQCLKDIATANKELDKIIRTKLGRHHIGKVFELCTPLSGNEADNAFLLTIMTNLLAGRVQYDYFGKNVQELCNQMLEKSKLTPPVKRYSTLMNFILKKYNASCLPTDYTSFIEYNKLTDRETSKESSRTWLYQTCTEFGYYQTTRKTNNTFSKLLTLDFKAGPCADIFRSSFDHDFISQAVNNTNESFGGKKINVNRIVFINGEMDPWQVLGITSTNKWSNYETIFIKGASHCADLRFQRDNDPKHLKAAQTKVQYLLSKWLKEDR